MIHLLLFAALTIAAPADTWMWVDIPGAVCRDGSAAPIAVNWHPGSQKVVMHLDGGWACWNAASCARNPASIGAKTDPGSGGMWNRQDPNNPFADFNFIAVRNCTGDFYTGNNPKASVPGAGTQAFMGYANLDLYLDRVLATFPQASQFVLAGTSAGGIGVYFNAEHFARRMPDKNFVALAACGHPVPASAFAPCLQAQLRDLWNLRDTVLADCGSACKKDDDFAFDAILHFLDGPNRSAGFLGAIGDNADRWVYGWGADQCRVTAPDLAADVFGQGVLELRKQGANRAAALSTYYGACEGHDCWLGDWNRKMDGVRLGDWVRGVLQGSRWQVGPQ